MTERESALGYDAAQTVSGKTLDAAGYGVTSAGGGLYTWRKPIAETFGYITIMADWEKARKVTSSLTADPRRKVWMVGIIDGYGEQGDDDTNDKHTLAEAIQLGDQKAAKYRDGKKPAAPLPSPATVADAFAAVLKDWLTPAEWEEMRERNAAETSPLVCHSHDHCDANMAMDAAIRDLTGITEINVEDPDINSLWNDAWTLAKAKHLTAPKVAP